MKCLGRTKASNFCKRCTRETPFLLCWQHAWQPFAAIVAIIVFLAAIAEFSGFTLRDILSKTNHLSNFNEKTNSSDRNRYDKSVPKREGNDVLVPLIILQAIPDFNKTKTVYAATYKNNWLNISNPEAQSDFLESSILKREGNVWRAIGLAGTRFHPVQLKNPNLKTNKFKPGNLSWLRIEDLPRVYGVTWERFSREFIDSNPPGPCFLIR